MEVYCYDGDFNRYHCSDTVNLVTFSTRYLADFLQISEFDIIYDITIEDMDPGSGYCYADYDDDDDTWTVNIQIAQSDQNEMIKTLAHEMVHAKQYVSGHLRSETVKVDGKLQTVVYWHGKKYSCKVDVEPWEKQAYSQEYQLMKQTLEKWRAIMDYRFDYRQDISSLQNFNLWYELNCQEREFFNDDVLPRHLAEKIFCDQYHISKLSE